MNNTILQKHPCENKCDDFKGEQCKHCLIKDDVQEPVALFISGLDDVEVHHQRAIVAQGEVS